MLDSTDQPFQQNLLKPQFWLYLGHGTRAGTSQKPQLAGTEEPILVVKQELVEEAEHVTEQLSIPPPQPIVVALPVLQPEEPDKPKINNSYLEEKHEEKEHTLLTEDINRGNTDEDLPSAAADGQAIPGRVQTYLVIWTNDNHDSSIL